MVVIRRLKGAPTPGSASALSLMISLARLRDACLQPAAVTSRRFEGIDPDEVGKLADEKRKLEEQQQLKAGEVEKVLESRIKTMKTDLERQLAGVTAEWDSLNARLTSIMKLERRVLRSFSVAHFAVDSDLEERP